MEKVVTESRRNIDKTKVYWRHKRRACSWCTIFSSSLSLSLFFVFTHPTVRSLRDTTSHHRLIISIHKKNNWKSRDVLLWPLRHPRLVREQSRVDVAPPPKINKLKCFHHQHYDFLYIYKNKQYMISTTKALEGEGETWSGRRQTKK